MNSKTKLYPQVVCNLCGASVQGERCPYTCPNSEEYKKEEEVDEVVLSKEDAEAEEIYKKNPNDYTKIICGIDAFMDLINITSSTNEKVIALLNNINTCSNPSICIILNTKTGKILNWTI
jgi:hypothetical protein